MRYALRNQAKIADKYGQATLLAIRKSLDISFYNCPVIPGTFRYSSEEPYPTISVPKYDYKGESIVFYVLGQKYDVVRLAFKEFLK